MSRNSIVRGVEENNGSIVFRSVVKEVAVHSPLALFSRAENQFKKERFYWKNAKGDFTFIGLGVAYHLEENDKTNVRYEKIRKRWEKLLQLHPNVEESRPILFGGFQFDPRQTIRSEWTYPSASFVVPAIQWTKRDGKSVVAFHAVGEESEVEQKLDDLQKQFDRCQLEVHQPIAPLSPYTLMERKVAQYKQAVQQTVQTIRQTDAKKVVIARALALQFEKEIPIERVLMNIKEEQPNSYHFAFGRAEDFFVGATPERLIEIEEGQAHSACVAGSIPRGKTQREDEQLGQSLWNDEKNREEHDYVVQMIKQVVSRYCQTYRIPTEPQLLKNRDIQHLYTPVTGTLREASSIFDWVRDLHPTPALGGVPTDVALDLILENEQMDRGFYAGPIGWTDATGDGEFAVAIRSTLVKGHSAYLYAGGGLVEDSEVETEYEETWVKFRPMLRALGGHIDGIS